MVTPRFGVKAVEKKNARVISSSLLLDTSRGQGGGGAGNGKILRGRTVVYVTPPSRNDNSSSYNKIGRKRETVYRERTGKKKNF